MHLWCAHNLDSLDSVKSNLTLGYQRMILCYNTGAIAITGGQFSNASVPVIIGRVNCIGNEISLLQCPYLSEDHEEVVNCDPSEVAAVTCQGQL